MHYILCIGFYALYFMLSILCIVFYALWYIMFLSLYFIYCNICIVFYAVLYMHCILNTAFYALHSMYCISCVVFYALYSMYCVLCIVLSFCGTFKLVAHWPKNQPMDIRTLSHIELLSQLKCGGWQQHDKIFYCNRTCQESNLGRSRLAHQSFNQWATRSNQ
jgi:hypothetical protein